MALPVTLDDVYAAHEPLGETVLRTPLVEALALSALTGAAVYLKLENLQRTGALKARGAGVRLMNLPEDEKAAGAATTSAGNHAQGVAYHAASLGIRATIFMPENTPFTKISRTEAFGAAVAASAAT